MKSDRNNFATKNHTLSYILFINANIISCFNIWVFNDLQAQQQLSRQISWFRGSPNRHLGSLPLHRPWVEREFCTPQAPRQPLSLPHAKQMIDSSFSFIYEPETLEGSTPPLHPRRVNGYSISHSNSFSKHLFRK